MKNHWTKNTKIKIPNCMKHGHLPYTEIKAIERCPKSFHICSYIITPTKTPDELF